MQRQHYLCMLLYLTRESCRWWCRSQNRIFFSCRIIVNHKSDQQSGSRLCDYRNWHSSGLVNEKKTWSLKKNASIFMTDIQLIRIDLNDRYENGQSKRKPSKERDKQQQNMTLWTIIIWSQVDRIELIFFPIASAVKFLAIIWLKRYGLWLSGIIFSSAIRSLC